MMRRPWVVGVEVPGEGIGEGREREREIIQRERDVDNKDLFDLI